MAAYAGGWWVERRGPGPHVALALLLGTAIALGIQSSTVQRFGVSGMSTTYLTGTLTTVVIRLATGRGVREVWHSIEILLGLVGRGCCRSGLVLLAPMFAPVLQLVALGAVVLVGATVAGKTRDGPPFSPPGSVPAQHEQERRRQAAHVHGAEPDVVARPAGTRR